MSSLISTRSLSTFFTLIADAKDDASMFSSILFSHATYPLNEPIPSNIHPFHHIFWGQPLLHYIIAMSRDITKLEILIQHARQHNKMLDPHTRDRTTQSNALHQAVVQRRMRQQDPPVQDLVDCSIIDLLISLGVTPNAVIQHGHTALQMSIEAGRHTIIHHLIDRFHPSNPHVRIPIDFHPRNQNHDNVFDIANDTQKQQAGRPKPHPIYSSPVTPKQFTRIIITVNRKYQQLYMEGMFQLLLGTHPRIGINSPARTFSQSHFFDAHLFPLIFSFLYRPLPTTNAQLAQVPIPSPSPPNPYPCSISGCLSTAHLICTRCHAARYCSKYCQVVDWKKHKITCKP